MINGKMPAMPLPLGTETAEGCQGLTKREMMAMHALQGLLAAPDLKTAEPVAVARAAIAYADSIIAELERTCRKT